MYRIEAKHQKALAIDKWCYTKTHNKQHVVEYLRSENSIINCPKRIADTFGTYFSEIGQKLGANIKSPKTKAKTYICKIPVNNKSLFPVSNHRKGN